MALANVWHLRAVAETASKPCWICHKPTTAVLITPDNKDFFYICRGHVSDRSFCSPIVDEAEAAARKKDMEREIELVKKEYEEKEKKKKEKKNGSKKAEEKGAAATTTTTTDGGKQVEGDKIEATTAAEGDRGATATAASGPTEEDLPRVYSLHRNFQQMRVDRIRKAEVSKRNQERVKNAASTFPSVPLGDP